MEELKIGLVGTGAIGRTHIERINNTLQGGKGSRLRGRKCRISASRLPRSTASRLGRTASDMIDDSDEIDAVMLLPPLDPYHEQYVHGGNHRPASMYSAKSRWHPRRMPASAS